MKVILQWLSRQTTLFYIACLLGALIYVIVAINARRQLVAAQFSLERRMTRQRVRRAWLMAGLFLLLGVFIFAIDSYIVPQLPATVTPTAQIEAGLTPRPTETATPTLTPTLTPAPLDEVLPTTTAPPEVSEATPTATPTPTPTPLPQAEPPDCPSPNVQIIAPAAGSRLAGTVEVRGTATLNAFAYYKFEVIFPGTETPNFIQQFETPVENGILGYWDISDPLRYPPGGPYRLRLVAVDIYGNATPCTIPIYITEQ
jgi:hypothetical protein